MTAVLLLLLLESRLLIAMVDLPWLINQPVVTKRHKESLTLPLIGPWPKVTAAAAVYDTNISNPTSNPNATNQRLGLL